MSRTSRNLMRVGTQTAQLALAVPQVVGHRVTRMMNAGAIPDARDVTEFSRMTSEKTAAFAESWFEMWLEMMRANERLAFTLMSSWWNAWFSVGGFNRHSRQLQSVALDVAAKGIAPVHRAVVANAKRLAKGRR
jgi:hypothetical protein